MANAEIPYLKLDPEVESAIRENRSAGWKNPHAFSDEDVLRREPKAHDEATITRPRWLCSLKR